MCLPTGCTIEKLVAWYPRPSVECFRLDLTMVPNDIPESVETLSVAYNRIENVSYLPPLPLLISLDLSFNSIETLSWRSLRALPELKNLRLQTNKLRVVELDTVIEYLPKLKFVNLAHNQLVSFSQFQLGWPQVGIVIIYMNPLRCDCNLYWLVLKLNCLQACVGKVEACCLSCDACFLADGLKPEPLCDSPSRLHRRSLLSESTLSLMECEQLEPTARTATKAAASTMMAAMRGSYKTQFLTNGTDHSTTQVQQWRRIPNKNDTSAITKTRPSPPDSTNAKVEKNQRLTSLHIVAVTVGSLGILTAIVFFRRLQMKHKLSCKYREDVNHLSHDVNPPAVSFASHGNSDGAVNHVDSPVNHAIPPISNSLYNSGGVDHDHLGANQVTPPAVNSASAEDDEIAPYAEGHPRDAPDSPCQSTNVGGLIDKPLATPDDAQTIDINSGHPDLDEQIAPYAIANDVEDDEIAPDAEGHLRDHDSLCESDASGSPNFIVPDGVPKFCDVYVSGDRREIRDDSSSVYQSGPASGETSVSRMYGNNDHPELSLVRPY
ncbi:LINGO4 [Branchiostoma lanceolatum]|uniref:LINGO4 protein n=1 Tax=Branchiostoma lanceolatum TaxID=7740 RepID=A0A8J9VPR3_BRALA|nr:LINGO4 [Branchiostoma lanceolatum]